MDGWNAGHHHLTDCPSTPCLSPHAHQDDHLHCSGRTPVAEILQASATTNKLVWHDRDNYLGAEGAKKLAAALEVNTGIRELQVLPPLQCFISTCVAAHVV